MTLLITLATLLLLVLGVLFTDTGAGLFVAFLYKAAEWLGELENLARKFKL